MHLQFFKSFACNSNNPFVWIGMMIMMICIRSNSRQDGIF